MIAFVISLIKKEFDNKNDKIEELESDIKELQKIRITSEETQDQSHNSLILVGYTGSGKSQYLHNIIKDYGYKSDYKFILVDRKRVEFDEYRDESFLLRPVIEKDDEFYKALKWINKEIDKRNKNDKFSPSILLLVDEYSGAIMANKKLVEDTFLRIAKEGKSVGISFIANTSRGGDSNVVTKKIEENIEIMGFKVEVEEDNKDTEIVDLTEERQGQTMVFGGQIKKSGSDHIDEDIKKQLEDLENIDVKLKKLYPKAKKIAMSSDTISAEELKRAMDIQYYEAFKLLDMLEEDGIVGPQQHQ